MVKMTMNWRTILGATILTVLLVIFLIAMIIQLKWLSLIPLGFAGLLFFGITLIESGLR